MKVTITGHTNGFGRILFSHLEQYHSVDGVSRINGYDLTIADDRQKLVSNLISDVLVLNARYGQAETIEAVAASEWPRKGRTMIVVGSRAPDAGLVSMAPLYAAEKAKVDFITRHTAVDLSKRCGTRVVLLRPTYISGCKHDDQRCVNSDHLCAIVDDILENPVYNSIREITLFPLH